MTLGELEQATLKLSRSEQGELYNFIRGIIGSTREFNLGDSVKFTSRGGENVSGKIIKINRKTIQVAAKQDGRGRPTTYDVIWNVSPHLLEKI